MKRLLPRVTRFASVGVGIVLLSLGTFAILTARETNRSAHAAHEATLVSGAYDEAAKAVVSQGYWVTEYMLKLGPGARYLNAPEFRRKHRDAAVALERALSSVQANGSRQEQPLISSLLAKHRRYVRAAAHLFAAVDAGDGRAAVQIQLREVDPDFTSIRDAVEGTAAARRRDAFGSLVSLSHAHELIFTGTIVFFSLGLVVLTALGLLVRTYGRRVHEAREAKLAQFEQAALTDNLTGLRNHRAFHEDLARALSRRVRTGEPVSLLMLDLDRLKLVNDSRGHQAGDDLIIALAEVLRSSVRGADAGYRIGGDEFGVILAGEAAPGADRVLERIQHAFARSGPGEIRGVTGGIAEAGSDLDKDSLIRRSDLALVTAKRTGQKALFYTTALEPRSAQPARKTA